MREKKLGNFLIVTIYESKKRVRPKMHQRKVNDYRISIICFNVP